MQRSALCGVIGVLSRTWGACGESCGRRARIANRRLSHQLDGKISRLGFDNQLVNVTTDGRICNELDLRFVEPETRQRNGCRHVGVLRVSERGLAGRTAIEDARRLEPIQRYFIGNG